MDRKRLLSIYRAKEERDEDENTSGDGSTHSHKKLSLFFASLCVIDLFGVFPIIALPRSIILCGNSISPTA